MGFLKALAACYGEDDIAGRAAALAYFAIFSIGPLLFVIFGIIGQLLKNEDYHQELLEQMQATIGPEAGELITTALENQNLAGNAGIAFFIGAIGLVLAAAGIFGQLQKSFNAILGVKAGPDAGLRAKLKQKVSALALVGVTAFMLIVSLVASALISTVTSGIGGGILFSLFDLVASILVLGSLLTLLYRTLPDVKLPWKPLFVASLTVAVLFSIGKIILGVIIGNNTTVSAYGAAGSLVALLLWVFYSAQIVYLGASGISIYADTHELKLVPRYRGKKGVLRVKRVEEPLEKPLWHKLLEDFGESLKEAWRNQNKQ